MNATQRRRITRVLREAEGYLELGMSQHALLRLQKNGTLIHSDARGCYLLGETLRELHRYRQAIYPLRRSLELIPDDVNVHMALAWCYKRTGRLETAIELLEHALTIEPGAAILHYNLACYWSLARDRRRTLQHLAAALEIDGNFRDFVWDEPDFDAMRADPLFQSLTA